MAISNVTRDSIVALQQEAAVFDARLGIVEADLVRHDTALMRERLAKLEERADKLVKDRDESSRHCVQVALFAGGATLTVAVQLVIRSLPTK